MAWIEKGPSGTWIARGRGKNQKEWEFDTKFKVDPDAVEGENVAKLRANSKAGAQETANMFESRVRGLITKEEYVARLNYIAERVVNGTAKVTVAEFIVYWLWEWVIRNRIHQTKVGKLCRLFNGLLTHIGSIVKKDAKCLTRDHLSKFIFERRKKGYAPAVVNDDVNYLKTMAQELQLLIGIDVSELLELELKVTQERLSFEWEEILRIFEVLNKLGKLGRDWKTFLLILLYTGLRPCDAARLIVGQIDLKNKLIFVNPSKTRRFGRNDVPRVIHPVLFNYLNNLLTEFPRKPEDPLSYNFANRSVKSITCSFNDIMEKAEVSKQVLETEYLSGKFSKKTLYSFRHTFNVLMMSVGADREQRKVEMGHKSDQSHLHYEHDTDSRVVSLRHKLISLLPEVPANLTNDTP